MLEQSNFYRAIREFALTEPAYSPARIEFDINPNEKWDLTKVSRRAYGNPHEFLAVMAAAGLTRFNDPLLPQRIVLPNRERLAQIKKKTGYSSGASQ